MTERDDVSGWRVSVFIVLMALLFSDLVQCSRLGDIREATQELTDLTKGSPQ